MKKVLSLLLAVIICFSVATSAFADTDTIERTCPKIFVNGFMASTVWKNPDDPNSETAWPPSQDAILNTVKNAIGPIAKLMLDGNWDNFAVSLSDVIDELFAPACADYNGEITNGSGIRFEYPEKEEINKDTTVEFKYDWRVDPMTTAKELNKFIDYVLKCSNSKEVVIECHSLGGVITSTYLKMYGHEKVRSVLFNATAIYGETYTGELFQGKVKLNGTALRHFLDYAFDDTDGEELLSLIFKTLDDAGVLDFVCNLGDDLVANIYDKAMLSVVKLFANWTTVWAMVPDVDMPKAEAYVFDEIYKNADIDCTGIKEKVHAYNNQIRKYKTETLLKLNKEINVYVLSRYGYCSIPITPSWDMLGDGVIDTKFNSFGATTALFGEKLDVADSKYLSPDKTVDASTCLFPEQTWFIRNIKHSDMPSCVNDLVDTLLYSKGQATVDTYEEYPRFLEYDADNNKLVIDEVIAQETFFDKLLAIIMKIMNAIKAIFVK